MFEDTNFLGRRGMHRSAFEPGSGSRQKKRQVSQTGRSIAPYPSWSPKMLMVLSVTMRFDEHLVADETGLFRGKT